MSELGGFGSFTRAELAAIGARAQIRRADADRPRAGRCGRRSAPAPTPFCSSMPRAAPAWSWCAPSSGEKQGSLLAAIDRTVTGAGARELAARLASPLRDVTRIDCRLDAVGFLIDQETLRADLRAALQGGAGHRPRRVAARLRARLAARSGGGARWAGRGRGAAPSCWPAKAPGMGLPEELGRIAGELQRGRWRAGSGAGGGARRRSAASASRDGGFVRQGYRPELDEARRLKEDSRGVMAGLEAQYVERDRRQIAEGPPQQHPRLLHRGDAGATPSRCWRRRSPTTFRHRQTMANAVRFSTVGADRHRGTHRLGHRARPEPRAGGLRRAGSGHRSASSRGLGRIAAALAELDATAGARRAGARRGLHAPRGRRQPGLRDPRRAPPGRRAGAEGGARPAPSSRTIACSATRRTACRRLRRDGRRAHLARHRPQHGRQVDVPAPERAHRRAGADGLVRAGALGDTSAPSTACSAASAPPTTWRAGARPSWSRWSRRPPSSIRRATARWSSSTRSAAARRPSTACRSPGRRSSSCTTCSARRALFATHYHELTALARRLAGRRQRDHGRARVARRDRLPAQGEAGRRRSLVWHPGRQAGRAAGSGRRRGRARC